MDKDYYSSFVESLARRFNAEHPSVCFYVYGSYARGAHSSRRGSDIDGGVIFNCDMPIPIDELNFIASLLADCSFNGCPKTQFNVLDTQSSIDGRFLSYTTDYTDYFGKKSRVLSGPDLRSCLNGLDYKAGVLHSASHNFRAVRNDILYARIMMRDYPIQFAERVIGNIGLAVKIPKKLLWLQGGEIIEEPREAVSQLRGVLPKCNFDNLERALGLYEEGVEVEHVERGIDLLVLAHGVVEDLIRNYIVTFSRSPRELRG